MKYYREIGKKGRTTIPYPVRVRLDIRDNDLISYEEKDDGAVIVRREKLCQNRGPCPVEDSITLYDILNCLTEQERIAAMIHLSQLMAESEGKKGKGDMF